MTEAHARRAARVAAHKANQRARLEAFATGELPLGPASVHIDVTNACNIDCVTCWDHSPHLQQPRPISWKRQRADPAQFEQLLADIDSLGGLEAVIVSGMGEPFTHPQIYELLAAVKRRGLHLTVITNLLAADPARILELEVDCLLLGIHAASERAYLDFHPSWSARDWQRLQSTLAQFSAAGRRGDKHVHVICKHNAGELIAMIEQAARLHAARVNFKLASLRAGTEVVGIDADQRARLRSGELAAAKQRAEALGLAHNLDAFALQLEAGGLATAPIDQVGCFMGQLYSRITVDGTVLYCCNTEVVVGQLDANTRFSQLWHGPSWTALRERLRQGRYLPSCSQCGKFNQNLTWSERVRAAHGEARWLELTGRGTANHQAAAPTTGAPPSADAVASAMRRLSLPVLR
ncbi:radical SAM domain protein [Enhygromyxa salina]|uniref:Radical SAM domain protein n=1 Tax=Enhygromyxa salina TaxID=215803 RepID=A0A0C2D4S5_9BACT|nr:radical SAM protein [Enhygromyxa salina]KIG15077.1 radical SAM domain protein [Enhygromyxa salina]